MKSGGNYNSRRRFIQKLAAFAVMAAVPNFLLSCKEKLAEFVLKATGTNHILGHRLWLKNFPPPSKIVQIPYLIIGGGITGLSAARQLKKKGITDFYVLELERNVGGNSSNGANKYSKFPLAAHYLPLPNIRDKELLAFLEESKIIIGYKKGMPIFDEQQLCFDPNERLFIRNTWQSDLIPKYGNSSESDRQIELFFQLISEYRSKKGTDGKFFFDIPLHFCSKDSDLNDLDDKTMRTWLDENKFDADELLSYLDYCCKDDFGLGIEFVSAWAGIHYFAARKHENTIYNDTVLTWPEGNGRLVEHLKLYAKNNVLTNNLVYEIKSENKAVKVLVYNDETNESIHFIAEKVMVCTPQFINKYLFEERKKMYKGFHYAPWFSAAVTLAEIPDNGSFPLSWDNVILKGKGLGYVYNQHQHLEQVIDRKVITYYYSFSSDDLANDRKQLLKKPAAYWKELMIADLKIAHPDIEDFIIDIEIHKIGHGMISPVPGFLKGQYLHEASESIENKIYFAHSDLSGISIFEEAFHQGINVVNKVINDTTLDT
jgi:phytoene dehydrogenase-like protein